MTPAQFLALRCRLCGALPGFPCVYIWPKGVSRDGWHNPNVAARIARVGTPTARAHNERDPGVFERDRIERGLRDRMDMGLVEARKLYNWLALHGHIFKAVNGG